MDRFCRGCLVRQDEPAQLLRYTEKNRRLFVYSTGLQVKRNDTFTFQLCKDCYLSMKMACNFKKQCRNSDKKFKSYSALKENNETMDLSSYLKHNDDSLTYRFTTFYGSSTPAHQKAKEDDSESTSTSICNFMTDIMPETDLPETEARIIREVIEEEADVLDDSLDSHWLQDDASIDTDFRLDFSFSPFSTPRPVNNDRYIPKKLTQNKSVERTDEHKQDCTQTKQALDMPIINSDSSNAILLGREEQQFNYDEKIDTLDAVNDILKYDSENLNNVVKDPAHQCIIVKHLEETLINSDNKNDKTDSLDAVNDILKYDHEVFNITDEVPAKQCTIDKNLEEALKNPYNKAFSLDELLVSPRVIPGIKTPPTPLINNILFGEKLDIDENSNNSHTYKTGQCIESYMNVEGDSEMSNFDIDIKVERLDDEEIRIVAKDEVDNQKPSVDNPLNITNFYCKICDRNFESLKKMKRHSVLHTRILICDICAREFNDKTNLSRHVRTHMREPPKKHECESCKLKFSSERTLRMHKRAHNGERRKSTPKTTFQRHMCTQCTFATDKASNFRLHMRRHQKIFAFNCLECDKGFYRKADLTIHMRYHTGEKPFHCTFCDKSFARADGLTRHIKVHLGKPFKCEFCKEQFVNSTNLKNHHKNSKRCSKSRDKIANDQKKIDEENTSAFVTVVNTLTTLNNKDISTLAPEKEMDEDKKLMSRKK